MKKILLSSLMALMIITGCSPAAAPDNANSTGTSEKIKVMTSFHPIDQIVNAIGGDKVETTLFVPPGTDAHDFEPTARDMAQLREAEVLFINGLDMEPWAADGGISGSTKLMFLADGLDLIMLAEDDHEHEADDDHTDGESDSHDDEDDHDDHDHAGGADPHVWLGLSELKLMARNAANGLTMLSPEDESYFEANLQTFNEAADALASEFEPKFKPYEGKSFVTGHEAFAYLTRNIGLIQMAVEGPFAEGEPTPQKIRELVDHVRAEGITTIFVEETASPKVSETLARETGADLVTIPTLESEGELFPTIRDIYEKILTAMEKSGQ